MKFKKELVERIIREELAAHIDELKSDDDKDGEKPETQDGEQATGEKSTSKPSGTNAAPSADPTMDKDKATGSAPEDGDEEVPDEPDPADDELEDDGSEDGNEGDDDRAGGKVSEKLVGKRIQSITYEPKSKTVPGAAEIVVSFDETPDTFKILITKTGQVKYYLNGLHDEL